MHVIKLGKAKNEAEKYLNDRGISDVRKLSIKEMITLFEDGRTQYEDGHFSLDAFSSFCEFIFWAITKNKQEKEAGKFFDMISVAIELNYYERKAGEDKSMAENFIGYLTEVMEYNRV